MTLSLKNVRWILAVIPVFLALAGGCRDCGDGRCTGSETPANCPADCPSGGFCNDGTCDAGETILTCPADCVAVCGDGTCSGGETATSCSVDCGGCGNGVCSGGETAASCPADCGVGPGCGNSVVEGTEECDDGSANSDTIPDACRTNCTSPDCGDAVVDSGEQCDDGNTTNGDGCDSACQNESAPKTLFVADRTTGSPPAGEVLGFQNLASTTSNVEPDLRIDSSSTTDVSFPIDLVVTHDGSLIVGSNGIAATLPHLTKFASGDVNAAATNHNPGFIGTVTLPATPFSLAVDNGPRDILYVADEASGVISVYEDVSLPTFNDPAPATPLVPIRTFKSAFGGPTPVGIYYSDIGGLDRLYMGDQSTNAVQIFAQASTRANLTETPTTFLTGGFASVEAVFVDANDTLFVLSDSLPGVYIYFNASALSGLALALTPDITFTITDAGVTLTDIVVDFDAVTITNDLYVGDSAGDQILIFQSSTWNTGVTPESGSHDRRINGTLTRLKTPRGLYLHE